MAIGFTKAGGWRWPGDLPLIYDFQTDNGEPAEKCARHLLEFVRAYRSSEGHHPGIYTMPGLWERLLPHVSTKERRVVARCFLWQAEWGVEGPRPLAPWRGVALAVDRQRPLGGHLRSRRHEPDGRRRTAPARPSEAPQATGTRARRTEAEAETGSQAPQGSSRLGAERSPVGIRPPRLAETA